jgi:uncharacterized protein YydD (DUF2326 family)
LIKWLIAKGQPINEEDLDEVEEDVAEVVVGDLDLKEEEEVVGDLQDQREAERKTKLEDGYQSPSWDVS